MYQRFLCAGLLFTITSLAKADDWTQFRGESRENRSNETDLFELWDEKDGPPMAWISDGLGSGYASVAVSNGKIFTTGNFDDGQAAIALDEKTGDIIWKQSLTERPPKHGYPGSRSTPTIADGKAYLVTSDGIAVCLSVDDGSVIWKREFSDWGGKMMSVWGFSESPLLDGDKLICTPGGSKGMVVALNKDSGEEIWACTLPKYEDEEGVNGKNLKDGAGYASAVISRGGGVKQYVQLVGRGLIGINAENGKLLWRYKRVSNGTANIPTAIIDGDYVFTSTGYGTGSALLKLQSEADGSIAPKEIYWAEGKTIQNKHGGMVLVDGHIYCGHGNGNGLPICLDMASGDVAWGPERAKGKGETSLVYADGHVIMRREDGVVLLVKATSESFELVSYFEPEYQKGKTWAHPVIANGKLYLREQDKLMCYKLK